MGGWKNVKYKLIISMASLIGVLGLAGHVYASLSVNILAVNGTDEPKEKDIVHYLPHELGADDILDTAGLKLDYDINKKSFFVQGKVKLGPKETQTLRLKIQDVWKIEQKSIDAIKEQIGISFERVENTEYGDSGFVKKKGLFTRLDYIMAEQERYAENVGKRIDRFRIYEEELNKIRSDALSVAFWRSNPTEDYGDKVVKFNVQMENSSPTEIKKSEDRHYLPTEVKPEHILDFNDFDMRFDPNKGQSYLIKEEELNPLEKKQYEFSIVDIWHIPQVNIENLRTRAFKAYDLISKTDYVQNADFLMKSIKKYLEKIEISQSSEYPINQHISAFRINEGYYDKAEDDVEALEDLLSALRENLERSPLKKVLQKIKTLKSVRDIAKALFKIKPKLKNILRIIFGVIIFVGAITAAHFIIWGKRSKELKIPKREDEEDNAS